nr:NADH dehydrogenase subunit 4 [Glypthelmins sp. LW2G]
MGYKSFSGYFSLIAGVSIFIILVVFRSSHFFVLGYGEAVSVNRFFWCDSVSFYLTLLSVILWLSLIFFVGQLSNSGVFMVSSSVLFSILSYSCVNAFFFWVFYEMSILSLLLLLVVESPYSERYVASWYLMGYVVITSLPMLISLFYFSITSGSFYMYEWDSLSSGGLASGVLIFLAILFITKIPLFPFHVWLPIVHAEASSIVSVCLSGYIMKLGLLGGVRFCSWVLPDYVFSYFYSLLILFFSVVFFFSACRELDGKRWLALLSLSHIVMSAVCLSTSSFDYSGVAFFYCLGHGLSAGVTFILLWVLYDITGSRNWFLVKNCVSSSLLIRACVAACLCTVASLPPTIQFFSEVFIICSSGEFSVVYIFLLSVYLFLGGLVPVFLLGGLLSRHYSISFGYGSVYAGLCSVVFLLVWSYLIFLFV